MSYSRRPLVAFSMLNDALTPDVKRIRSAQEQ